MQAKKLIEDEQNVVISFKSILQELSEIFIGLAFWQCEFTKNI
jgi:hypothetical protein